MTDEITTPVAPTVETTDTNSEVSKPLVTSKPYDDEMLEAYEAEANAETETPEVKKSIEPPKDETLKTETDKTPNAIEETPLTKLINGKQVEFKIKDAVDAFVQKEEFNRQMSRRVNEVAHREQRWTQDQNKFKETIGKVIGVAQQGDFVSAVRALAKLAFNGTGSDVVEFEKQYFSQLDKVGEVYSKMTPQERETYFAKRSAAESKSRADALEEEKTVNTEKSQLQESVASLQKQYGLKDEEFWGNYKVLEETQVGKDKAFKTPHEIKTEDVIRFSLRVRHEEKVVEAGKKVGIDDDAILDGISEITSKMPDLTADDIVKIIETSGIAKNAKPEAVENLNRKVGKSKAHFTQANSTKKENGKVAGLDKEDLDFLYRRQPKVFVRPAR